MACMTLPPRQRLWGMILGAGVAVLLRVRLHARHRAGDGLPVPQAGRRRCCCSMWRSSSSPRTLTAKTAASKARSNLWRAVRIVAIADIVMSLDNVIAIAASAEVAAARVDLAHAAGIKTTLIIFGLATSVPLIVAGSAILMALLERYRVLVWGGGALLGWVAGDIMATDPAPGRLVQRGDAAHASCLGRPGRRADRPRRGLLHRRPAPAAACSTKSWPASRWWSGSSSTGSAKACWAPTPDPLKIWGIRGVLIAG